MSWDPYNVTSWEGHTGPFPAFVPSTDHETLDPAEVESAIPDAYRSGRLRLLPRHPRGVLMYWDLADGSKDRLVERAAAEGAPYGGGSWELRLGAPHAAWGGPPPGDVITGIHHPQGNWFIEVSGEPPVLQAWIGWCSTDGRFWPLLRSEVVDLRDFAPGHHRGPRLRRGEVWRSVDGERVDAPPVEGDLSRFAEAPYAGWVRVGASAWAPVAGEDHAAAMSAGAQRPGASERLGASDRVAGSLPLHGSGRGREEER